MLLLWLQCTLLWTVSSFDISWFKETSFHEHNIIKLSNGWEDCKDWQGKSGGQFSINEFGKIITFDIPEVPDIQYNFTAKCITLKVPLDWDDSNFINDTDIQTINYFISHIYAQNNSNISNNGAFWMLAGGPGSPGTAFYSNAIPWLTFLDGTFDLYLPDHRGTGSSNPLYCPGEIVDSPQNCSAFINQRYGIDIEFFSTYAASMDLGYCIDLFLNNMSAYNKNNTVVYGLSYGTYYLNQYLQIFPNQTQAVILDGVCPPDICNLMQYDYNSNQVGITFLEHCENDIFCSNMLKEYGSPYDTIVQLFDNIENNSNIVPCFQKINGSQISVSLLQNLLFYLLAVYDYRPIIPPLLYRLHRCNVQDQEMMKNIPYLAAKLADQTPSTGNVSDGLQWNIVTSELLHTPNISQSDTYYFAIGLSISGPRWWNAWPKYVPNPLVYQTFADPVTPILILNGDLDPQTPVEWALHSAQQYKANINNDSVTNPLNRYFYVVPNAPHVAIWYSPIVNHSQYVLETCGMRIIKSFIDPHTNYVPDATCINWIKPIDWEGKDNGTRHSSKVFFNGHENIWQYINLTTITPTISPSIMPTANPIVTHEIECKDSEKTWFIVAVVFIVLFCLSVIAIGVLVNKLIMVSKYNEPFKKPNINDGKGKYGSANTEEIEAGVYNTR